MTGIKIKVKDLSKEKRKCRWERSKRKQQEGWRNKGAACQERDGTERKEEL